MNRIALVKPEKAREAENAVMMKAQMGQLSHPLSEAEFVELLTSMNERSGKETTVKIQRRTHGFDED